MWRVLCIAVLFKNTKMCPLCHIKVHKHFLDISLVEIRLTSFSGLMQLWLWIRKVKGRGVVWYCPQVAHSVLIVCGFACQHRVEWLITYSCDQFLCARRIFFTCVFNLSLKRKTRRKRTMFICKKTNSCVFSFDSHCCILIFLLFFLCNHLSHMGVGSTYSRSMMHTKCESEES